MRQAGVRTLRVSLGWDGIEPERDRYDLAFWDAFIELAVREYGLRLIPYVAYTPEWNSDADPGEHWRSPPREPREFAQLMALLAARYRNSVQSWELWNEPDNRDYWLGSVEQYAELARLGAEAIRGVDSELDVVSGGIAGRTEFLAQLFDEHEGARIFDVVNVHSYYETWNPEPIETLSSYVDEVTAIVRRHGGRQAIWMAELGYGNFRRGSRVSHYTTAAFAHEHTLEFQAVALVRSLALLAPGPVSLAAWYELKDPAASDAMIGDENNRHLGIAFHDYRPKPAFHALSFLSRLLAGGVASAQERVRVLAGASAHVAERQLHAFATARGSLVLVAWLGKPRGAQPRGDGDEVDQRREVLRVQVLDDADRLASFYDAQGQLRSSRPLLARDGALELDLELTGPDVQVVELTDARGR